MILLKNVLKINVSRAQINTKDCHGLLKFWKKYLSSLKDSWIILPIEKTMDRKDYKRKTSLKKVKKKGSAIKAPLT